RVSLAGGIGGSTSRIPVALHPLVDSVTVARRLVDGYRQAHPQLAYLGRRTPDGPEMITG
ncbi:hypothetical protein ABZ366_22340, partial [Streptomyces sp. NPDC005904]